MMQHALPIRMLAQANEALPFPGEEAAASSDGGLLAAILMMAGVSVLTATLLLRLVKRRKRLRDRGVNDHLQPASESPSERMRRVQREAQAVNPAAPLERATVEAQETARRIAAEMETRAQRLEALIANAERTMAALEATRRSTSSDDTRAPRDTTDQHGDGYRPTREQLAGLGFHQREPVDVRTRPEAAGRALEHAPDPLGQRVRELAGQGYSPVQIAQELGEQTGKVELILALGS
jgi:hypothetical protein